MAVNNKKFLASINNLTDLFNLTRNSIDQESEVNPVSEENNLPAQTTICKSSTPISWYSKNYITDSLRDKSCLAVVSSLNHSTSPACFFTSDAQIQTFKTYHQSSRKTQTRNPAKKKLFSKNSNRTKISRVY